MGGARVNTLARASLPDPSQLEMESSSQRRQRLGRLRAARTRASGTELQREHRREVHRSRMRVIRQGESEARRSQRLANLAEERALVRWPGSVKTRVVHFTLNWVTQSLI